jgi:hypothetical protein
MNENNKVEKYSVKKRTRKFKIISCIIVPIIVAAIGLISHCMGTSKNEVPNIPFLIEN